MKEGAFLFVLVPLAYVLSAQTGSEIIWVKDVTKRLNTSQRTHIDLDLPDKVTFHLSRRPNTLTLNLERNHDINPNTDMYFLRKVRNGQLRIIKSRNLAKENVAYYQDMESGASMTIRCVKQSHGPCGRVINVAYYQDIGNGASMTIRCVKQSHGPCGRIMNGNMRIGESSYELRSAEDDVIYRNVFNVPGLLGKPYILKDVTNIRKTYSIENEVAKIFDETKVKKRSKDGIRRLPGRSVMSSSRTVTGLDNRGAMSEDSDSSKNDVKEKIRWLKKKYYVDVAVLVDSSIWDIHASTVKSTNILKFKNTVQTRIRGFFSHIINSVNLLYKGISDSSASIRVKLSAFIFFSHRVLFPHNSSRVITIDGKTHIAASPFLNDFTDWDKAVGVNSTPLFDHAMLFTRHDLYKNSIEENIVFGVSWTGGVCNPGKRTSIIQTDDYEQTVRTAAHELGHNLGADHDGEDDATDCDPADMYIMSPNIVHNTPFMNYTKNLYYFSECSVRSFKRTLKQKDCVKRKGKIYNKGEWKLHVSKQPGEAYTADMQCHLINGPKSVSCRNYVLEDICHALQCTDPNTNTCKPLHYNAATGTVCGHFRRCFEGRCAP